MPFILQVTEPLTLAAVPPLSQMYTLSPFVWKDSEQWDGYGHRVRVVCCRDR